MTQDKILILDFGSQVTQLIARRVREAHVYCELHSYDLPRICSMVVMPLSARTTRTET